MDKGARQVARVRAGGICSHIDYGEFDTTLTQPQRYDAKAY